MEAKTLVAIDPGRTIGVAVAKVTDRVVISYSQFEFQPATLWSRLSEWNPSMIICESFRYRQRATGADLTAVEVIGIVRLWCDLQGVSLLFQTPAQGKSYWSDDKLRQLDLYERGLPHGRDACRHLLYWLHFGSGYLEVEGAVVPGEERLPPPPAS